MDLFLPLLHDVNTYFSITFLRRMNIIIFPIILVEPLVKMFISIDLSPIRHSFIELCNKFSDICLPLLHD